MNMGFAELPPYKIEKYSPYSYFGEKNKPPNCSRSKQNQQQKAITSHVQLKNEHGFQIFPQNRQHNSQPCNSGDISGCISSTETFVHIKLCGKLETKNDFDVRFSCAHRTDTVEAITVLQYSLMIQHCHQILICYSTVRYPNLNTLH